MVELKQLFHGCRTLNAERLSSNQEWHHEEPEPPPSCTWRARQSDQSFARETIDEGIGSACPWHDGSHPALVGMFKPTCGAKTEAWICAKCRRRNEAVFPKPGVIIMPEATIVGPAPIRSCLRPTPCLRHRAKKQTRMPAYRRPSAGRSVPRKNLAGATRAIDFRTGQGLGVSAVSTGKRHSQPWPAL